MNVLINQLLPNNVPCLFTVMYYMCVEPVIINHRQKQI